MDDLVAKTTNWANGSTLAPEQKRTRLLVCICDRTRTLVECRPMDKDAKRVTVHKLDHAGRRILAYEGEMLQHKDGAIVLGTTWERPSLDLGYVVLETGSQWTEYFFATQWYNIFEICASDGRLLGWYCNITRPARISIDEAGGKVSAEDLALDLWVAADGKMLVLDEDEFAELPISSEERVAANRALSALQTMVLQREAPFDKIQDSA
jgi:protein associated with RNAse G/E